VLKKRWLENVGRPDRCHFQEYRGPSRPWVLARGRGESGRITQGGKGKLFNFREVDDQGGAGIGKWVFFDQLGSKAGKPKNLIHQKIINGGKEKGGWSPFKG